jgi:hypothetical protein
MAVINNQYTLANSGDNAPVPVPQCSNNSSAALAS